MSTLTIARAVRESGGRILAYFPDGSSVEWPSLEVLSAKASRATKGMDRLLYAALSELMKNDPDLSRSGSRSITVSNDSRVV